MTSIKIKVNKDSVEKIDGAILRSGSFNIDKFIFEFSEEYEGLVKKALIVLPNGESLDLSIIDDELIVPVNMYKTEFVNKSITLGVYAYAVEENEFVLRYSPRPILIIPKQGSYDKEKADSAKNIEEITPTDLEIYFAKFNEIYEKTKELCEKCEKDYDEVKEEINDLKTTKQDKLIAGENISIDEDNTINAEMYDDTDIKNQIEEIQEETSQLERDIVNTDNKVTALQEELQEQEENINHLDDIKANRTELINFITKTVDNLVNYYKKSETYTQTEINQLIGAIKTISMKVVPEKPQTGETNIIYLVPSKKTEPENIYNEWIYVNDKWELIGTTEVDLSNYYTIEQINAILYDYITSNDLEEILLDYALKSDIKTDNNTISKNTNNEFQSIGSILKNGGFQNYWKGTKSEYNEIAEKDPNTLYEILDDEETALFEVDGNTIEFSSDNILQIPAKNDLMFQSITYGNRESGYRKWRNGYIEQWGVATSNVNGDAEFTMHQSHIDQNFSVFIEPREQGNFFHYAIPSGNQKFRARIQSRDSISMAVKFQWRSYGYWK